jgi:dTDP-4-amino-4,6-dideoxygalactose transaminase
VTALTALAKEHGLKLVFDAAHAFCSQLDGTYIGNFGDAEIFSFHATKFFNTFEGGAITTHDLRLAEKLRLMRNFGFSGEDNVIELGINGKLNELSAAMGLTLLPDLPELLAASQRNYGLYEEMLEGLPGLRLLQRRDRVNNNCQYVVIELNGKSISRDLAYEILRAENIRVRRYFYPGSHRMEPYRSQPDLGSWRLQVTERLVDEILCLPNNASMPPKDARKIGELLQYIVVNGKQIENRAASEGFALE